MDVEIVHESITYSITVKVDEDTRQLLQWSLGYTDNSLATRDGVARWITDTLLAAVNGIRRAKFVKKEVVIRPPGYDKMADKL